MNPYQVIEQEEPSNEESINIKSSRCFLHGLLAACFINVFMECLGYNITLYSQALTSVILLALLIITDGINLFKILKG